MQPQFTKWPFQNGVKVNFKIRSGLRMRLSLCDHWCHVKMCNCMWDFQCLWVTICFCLCDFNIVLYSYRWSSVYLVTLWIIVRRELLKFLIIAVLSIFAFSAALRFAVQAERHEAFRLLSTPANQSRVCVLENGTNTTCKAPLTHTLAGHLLEELEWVQWLHC